MTGEPRWSEAEIRAAFASAPYGLGVKAWLSADHLIAALSAVGAAPAEPTHEFTARRLVMNAGFYIDTDNCDCGKQRADPVHLQRGERAETREQHSSEPPTPKKKGLRALPPPAQQLAG